MTSLALLRALLFAGECLAGSVVILGLAFVAAGRIKDRAALRHLIWAAAFGGLLVLPALALLLPAGAVMTLPAAHAAKTALTQTEVLRTPLAESLTAAQASEPAAPVVDIHDAAPVAPQSPAPRFHVGVREAVLGGFAVWVSGLFWMAFNATTSAFGLHLMRRESIAYAPDCTPVMPLNRGWELRLATRAGGCGPVTWGVARPVVLLPQSAVLWSRTRLEAVLTHELAHVRRRDALTQSLVQLACAVYWPNPLVWMAARALRREAEMAADDAVLDAGIKPSAYAGELVQLAAEFRADRLDAAVAMASPSALEARIRSLLAPARSRKGVTPMDAIKIAALGSACCIALAMARPDLALAQPTAPVAPVAAQGPVAPSAPEAIPAPERMPVVQRRVHVIPPVNRDDEHGSSSFSTSESSAEATADGDTDANTDISLHGTINGKPFDMERHYHGHAMTPEERAHLHAKMEKLRAEMARIRPRIEKAIAEAHIGEKAARALEKAQPEIDAAIDRAMAEVGPAIDRAMAEADHANIELRIRRERRHDDNDNDDNDDVPPPPPPPGPDHH